jgi:hypothetical protein
VVRRIQVVGVGIQAVFAADDLSVGNTEHCHATGATEVR